MGARAITSCRTTIRQGIVALIALLASACNVLVGVTDVTFSDASSEGGDATADGSKKSGADAKTIVDGGADSHG